MSSGPHPIATGATDGPLSRAFEAESEDPGGMGSAVCVRVLLTLHTRPEGATLDDLIVLTGRLRWQLEVALRGLRERRRIRGRRHPGGTLWFTPGHFVSYCMWRQASGLPTEEVQ